MRAPHHIRVLLIVVISLILASFGIAKTHADEKKNPIADNVSASTQQLLALPKIREAIAGLKNKRVSKQRTETYTVTHYVKEQYWECYCYRGRMCWRLCTKLRRVMEQKTRTYTQQVKAIGDHTIFDDPTDPRVGEFTVPIDLKAIPSAAGGRASRISAVMQRHIPDNVLTNIQDEDRVLAGESTDFSAQGAPTGFERKFRIVAIVDEDRSDRIIGLTVMVAERKTSDQILETDKVALRTIAQQIATVAADELAQ